MIKTKFLGVRKPTEKEVKYHSCDYVFMRENHKGDVLDIFVSKPYKDYGWFQWGQSTEILCDNVNDLEEYFNGGKNESV